MLQILCVKCRNISTGCLGATVVQEGCIRLCEFISGCIHQQFGIQENSGEVRQRTIIVELDERVMNNLKGVELVQMTHPEGDHQANGLAEVGVRETRLRRESLGVSWRNHWEIQLIQRIR